MSCDVCGMLERKEAFALVYEDERCFVVLHESPAAPGHLLVIPKRHAAILEELDDATASHLFVVANKMSTALFEVTGAQGTNILVNNGPAAGQELPHVLLHVLPRREGDGISLEWQATRASDGELKTAQSLLQSIGDSVFTGKSAFPAAAPSGGHAGHDAHHADHGGHGGASGHSQGASGQAPSSHAAHAGQEKGGHGHAAEKPEAGPSPENYLLKSLRRIP